MSIWLLEAKAWPEDTRSEAAKSACFWLVPGTYSVGRKEGQCDIDVPEDKSISRLHAEINVPLIASVPEDLRHYINVTDKSKYGTCVSKENNLEHSGQVETVQQVEHRWLIRFGYASPFRVKNLNWSVLMHPSCPPETITLARSLGFAIINDMDDLPSDYHESSYLIMPPSEAPIDAIVLNMMMIGVRVVSEEWLFKWKERKAWKNQYPKYEEYPAIFHHGTQVLLEKEVREKARLAAQQRPLEKLKFLWKSDELGVVNINYLLREAVGFAGGSVEGSFANIENSQSRDKKSCILALPSTEEWGNLPASLKKDFRWTTYDRLTQAILNGTQENLIHEAGEETEEEKVAAAVYQRGTVPDSEDETEAMPVPVVEEEEEEEVKVKKTKRKQSSEAPSRSTRSKRKLDASVEEINEEQQEKEVEKSNKTRGKKTAAVAPTADTLPAPSKRQRTRATSKIAASQEDSIPVTAAMDSPPSVHPSSKGRRAKGVSSPSKTKEISALAKNAPAADAEAEAEAQPTETVKNNKNKPKSKAGKVSASPSKNTSPRKGNYSASQPQIPTGDGWKTAKRGQGAPRSIATAAATAAAEEAVQPSSSPPATAAAVDAAAAPAAAAQEENKTSAVDASAIIVDANLIVAPLNNNSRLYYDSDGVGGFKAFRRKGSTVPGGTSRLPRIPFDPEPYMEGQYRNEDFLREEAEREAAMDAADALFDANVKPKRDKKTVEEEKKKLLAMLPEAARRRLEK